ncbi:Desiccation-related protein PCC13-62 [Hibiscus syriacus]|uniref:Desiccation-related protein PCC13-62 n=1 Tax=Hibiscus syriacus TaxID=106335 RepID=A0A6A2Y358_HIBSY|nr:desiccation-related protein PCC13-62-like [Hibiscus syriacus]KAE8662624.1 Desiccation-related protein PCC13-62 [Hibiscus syriacus]
MATPSRYSAIILFLLPLQLIAVPSCPGDCEPIDATDRDWPQFAMNLEFLETEWFLCAAHGRGLDAIEPEYAKGGPPPIGCKKANLDRVTRQVVEEFGYQEVGHLRAILKTVGGIQRPQIDIRSENIAKIFDEAMGCCLDPPFDPYEDSIKYLLASYVIPYVGLNGYVGMIPCLQKFETKKLVAGLLGVESGQDATIRAWLYEKANENVEPYNITVTEFTTKISKLRNKLGHCGIKDEGIMVPPELGAENRTSSNVLSADYDSLSYPRTPAEIARITYGTGDEHRPGGFFPEGANGRIAREYLYNDKLKVL